MPLRTGHCRECGASYEAGRATREFCGMACRRAFSNRRMLRGADMYDLLMQLRFDRERAKRSGAWSLLCRMAAAFKAEDDRERAGHASPARRSATAAAIKGGGDARAI
ncbi:MAG: transcriptional regulator [Xanthobacteraceae bacterium]|jgi:hypothetical protein